MSIVLHLQDEGTLSAEDTPISPPRVFHIPLSPPPRTLNDPLPGPSMINTNNDATAIETHQQPVQKTIPANPQLQPQCKTPLLPTPAAPARQFSGKSVIPGPSSHNNSQNHYKQFIPGPSLHNKIQTHYKQFIPRKHNAVTTNQQPPLQPTPSYNHFIPGYQVPTLPRPYPHVQGHLIPQVSTYLPVLLPYPSHLITSLQYKFAA